VTTSIDLNESERQFILRLRESKLSRCSKLQRLKEIIANLPHEVKAPLFEQAYASERAKLAMFSRML